MTGIREFTYQFNEITSRLITDIECSVSFENRTPPLIKQKFKAIWDTGSSVSFITKNVVEKLNLQHDGFFDVATFESKSETRPAYKLGIHFSNEVFIEKTYAGEQNITGGFFDVVIGMDIINRGIFSIDSLNTKTILKFKIPIVNRVYFSQSP